MLGLTERSGDIMRTVDKLDKIGAGKVRTCLTEDVGLTAEQADEIMRFISITGSNRQVLDALAGYQGQNEVFDQGLEELNTVTRYLSAFGVPEENFAVDLTIARGLDYYTGTVYETTLLDYPEIGSVCSGGRYDNLAAYTIPTVSSARRGHLHWPDKAVLCAERAGLLNPQLPTAPADVLILPMTQDLTPAIRLATRLRSAGVRTQLYTEQKKVQGQDELCRQAGGPLCGVPGGRRDRRRAGGLQGYDLRRADQAVL